MKWLRRGRAVCGGESGGICGAGGGEGRAFTLYADADYPEHADGAAGRNGGESMTLKLVLKTPNNRIILSDRIASFVLEKEAYTPYSQLRIVVYGALEPELYAQVYRVQLLLDETELHLGTVEQCQTTRQQGSVYIQIVSRGLTAMLLQNQLTPGLHSGMSLDRLMTGFYSFPQEITWERSTDASNYLYVKENTSMWDGLANLSYKLYERYPFIRGANEIRMHLPDTYQHYVAKDNSLLAAGTATDQSLLYSDFYMADVDGTYEKFHEAEPEAAARGIVRTKQLALDRQYLYDPQQALVFRRKFAGRRLVRRFVDVIGPVGLSLGNKSCFPSQLLQHGKHITWGSSRIRFKNRISLFTISILCKVNE